MDISCPICVKAVLDAEEGVGCDADCQRWFHRECIKMSKQEYQRISGDNNVKWNCTRTDCMKSPVGSAKNDDLMNSIVSQLASLAKNVTEMSSKIDKLIDIPQKIDDLNSKITLFETKMSTLEERILAIEQSPMPSNVSREEIISEMNDRTLRAHNLMLFKMPESKSTQINDKKAHDRKLITQLFDYLCPGLVTYNFTHFRVGKKTPDKSRPIKIILKNLSDVSQLMGKFSTVDKSVFKGDLTNISLARDRTPGETKYLNDLRDELKRRTDTGEKDLTIKYRNGVPAIVQKN